MRRILFVDDEPMVLEGLRRLLRPCRHEWDLSFAGSGEDALNVLSSATFDVVVTDMRMPRMDGAELLELVRDRFPSVIRIVLSGYFDAEASLRAAPVAHQFLLKPCDVSKLRQAIESAFAISSVLSDDGIRRAVSAVGALPSIPDTCDALIRELEAPGGSLDRIRMIIQNDVGVAAKILHLASSAAAGLSEPVNSIEMALSLLGLDALKYLLLSVELFQTFQPIRTTSDFSLATFQRHSRLVASVTKFLPVSEPVRSQCEVAAFLHDIGKLVLASRFPDEFEVTLAKSTRSGRRSYEIEEEMLGTSHAQIGAYLLGLWGLTPEIVRAVSHHHSVEPSELESSGGVDIGAAVRIADALVHHCDVTSESVARTGIQFDYIGLLGGIAQTPQWIEKTANVIREIEIA